MSERKKDIETGRELIDKTQIGISAHREAAIQEIKKIFGALAGTAKKFSENGNLDLVSDLLNELELAKKKINGELENLLKQIQSQVGQSGESLQKIAIKLSEYLKNAEDSPKTIKEKESFETETDKKNKETALKFLQTNIKNQDQIRGIKEKINKIKYTQKGIKIGDIEWGKNNASNNGIQAKKIDFEKSFEWLFGEKVPSKKFLESEYPRHRKIAVIPFLLGLEKNGRIGNSGRCGVGSSGFYDLGDGRVLKFDNTGGTVRKKRDSDIGLSTFYVVV